VDRLGDGQGGGGGVERGPFLIAERDQQGGQVGDADGQGAIRGVRADDADDRAVRTF
jgi:hypothetical protein